MTLGDTPKCCQYGLSLKKNLNEHSFFTTDSVSSFPSIDAAKTRCLELNDCGGFVEDGDGDFFLRKDKNCLFASDDFEKTFIRPRPCSANSGIGRKGHCYKP